jgi:hypothetical protein
MKVVNSCRYCPLARRAGDMTNIDNDGNVPATPVNNWTQPGLNNFRQNYIEDVVAAPDLVIYTVQGRCDGDYALAARVRNIGHQAVPAGVPVHFYAGDPEQGGALLGVTETVKELYPAEAEDVLLPLPDASDAIKAGQQPIFALVNPDAKWLECRHQNNKAEGTGVCP